MKRILFACATLLAASAPATAQYYPYPPQGGYYQADPWGRPPPRPGWGGGGGYYNERPVSFGNVCVTSRGNCRSRPRPEQSPCSCFIEGFGPKRGAIIAGW
jgi:hypothetical protein